MANSFEFLRNDLMDARNFFNAKKTRRIAKPVRRRLVDRVRKNKEFFFGSVESFRSRQGSCRFRARFRPARRGGRFQFRRHGTRSALIFLEPIPVILFLIHGSRRSRKSSSLLAGAEHKPLVAEFHQFWLRQRQ